MQKQSVSTVEDIRYSDFVNAVEKDEIEKVSFSYDGKKLIAVDTDGVRVKLDSIPNDPELLTILTKHKVDVTVMPNQTNQGAGGFGQLGSLIFPALLFGSLLFLPGGVVGREEEVVWGAAACQAGETRWR